MTVKLKISILATFDTHSELVEEIRKASHEILTITRREKGLADTRGKEAGGIYLDVSTSTNSRQILFHNPTYEVFFRGRDGILEHVGGGRVVVDTAHYRDIRQQNDDLHRRLQNITRENKSEEIKRHRRVRVEDNAAIRRLPNDTIREVMLQMTKRERAIFKGRTLNEKPTTLRDLGKALGLSPERVRQLDARIMRKFWR